MRTHPISTLIAVLLVFVGILTTACNQVSSPTDIGAPVSAVIPVSFQQQILPILQSNCAFSGCHGELRPQSGLVTTSYDAVIISGFVVPGKSAESPFYQVLTAHSPVGERMPKLLDSLLPSQTALIKRWIDEGALDTLIAPPPDTSGTSYQKHIQPIFDTYCRGCHGAISPASSIRLTTYTFATTSVNPQTLLSAIAQDGDAAPMPRNMDKLTDANIIRVRQWIQAGRPNN